MQKDCSLGMKCLPCDNSRSYGRSVGLGNMGLFPEREYGVSSKGYRVSPRRDDDCWQWTLIWWVLPVSSLNLPGCAVKTLKYRVVCHGRITVRRNVPKHNASGFLAMGRSIVPLSFSNTLCTMPMYSLMKVLSFIWRMRNSWQYGFFANMMMPKYLCPAL